MNSAPPTSPARDSTLSRQRRPNCRETRAVEPVAVSEWVSRHVVDAAQAVFIGGNGFQAAGAIEALETSIGRPVLTSNQVMLWQLLAQADGTFEINGYGRLFARKP